MSKQENNEQFMKIAMEQALRGWGNTRPNPMVGAVIVKNNIVIGQGYHPYTGAHHAEVVAIKNVAGDCRGATLYVTLEPCCHIGKTPPCTKAVIEAGFEKVVIGHSDPDARVSGRGIRELEKAGIQVTVGILESELRKLNEGYIYFKKTGRPFIIMKIAETLDGKIATASGQSKWITGNESRSYSQIIRAGVDAILVGSGTLLADNPELVVHGSKKYRLKPARVIVDTTGRANDNHKVFQLKEDSPKTYWIIGSKVPSSKIQKMIKKGVEVVHISEKKGHIDIAALLDWMGKQRFQSILVEGGARIHGAFSDACMINKVICFVVPKLMGGVGSLTSIQGTGALTLENLKVLKNVSYTFLGKDLAVEGYL